jgi:hypothetical protein
MLIGSLHLSVAQDCLEAQVVVFRILPAVPDARVAIPCDDRSESLAGFLFSLPPHG